MIASAFVALGVTLCLAPLCLAVLRRLGVMDHPSARSSHVQPTPRGGGIAPALGGLAALASSSAVTGPPRTALAVAVVAFGLLGLADDVRGIPPLPRLALQVVAGALALPWLLHGLEGIAAWRVVFTVGVLTWLVAYVNALHRMDGINGISSAQVFGAGAAWYAVGSSQQVDDLAAGGLVVATAAAVFAPFNFPRARMFLGDVGSYFLGAWLAVLVVFGLRAGLPPEAVIAPLTLYLADTAATIVRRARRGERWYLAHRDHAYQRLTQLGWSHARTTTFVALAMAACAALGSLSLAGPLPLRLAGDGLLGLVLAAYLATPRLVSSLRPRQMAAVT